MNSISKNNVILILLSTLLRFIKSLLVTKNYIYYIVIFYTYELYFLFILLVGLYYLAHIHRYV